MNLIQNDDNYKNILQVKVQRAFKTTPDYIELGCDPETGYEMGVFVRLGKELHEIDPKAADELAKYGSLEAIQTEFEERGHVFVRLARSAHKIKKKAEQSACKQAIEALGN